MPAEKKDAAQEEEEEEGEEEGVEDVIKGKKKEVKIKLEEVEFHPDRFNPFDKNEIKKQRESEKPMQPRKVLNVKK